MGSILVYVPDLQDSELIYDENETKQIFKFFYPDYTKKIDTDLVVDNEAKRLAQTMLIAAIDGSYAMGYVKDVFDAVTSMIFRPNKSLKSLGQKLAKKFVARWFQHIRQSNALENIQIYDTVRDSIAQSTRSRFRGIIEHIEGNLRLRQGEIHQYVFIDHLNRDIWV